MSAWICTGCGATLEPGTGFCRKCGQRVVESAANLEEPTAILSHSADKSTTQPLFTASSSTDLSPKSELGWRRLILMGIVLMLAIGLAVGVTLYFIKRAGSPSSAQVSRSLIYPGSRTVVDVSDDGGGVLQMETPDALDNVRAWYEINLKPTKTLQMTSGSVMLKKENVTATLIAENNMTTVVIKQIR